MPDWIQLAESGVTIDIYVSPRASQTRAVGEHDGRLKVQVAAPPVDGAANKELLKYFSRLFGVGKSATRVMSGDTGRRKRIFVGGVTVAEATAKLVAP